MKVLTVVAGWLCLNRTHSPCNPVHRGAWLSSLSLNAVLAAALIFMLASCAGYVPGRQTYWDAKVREMCEKDGGVVVIDQIILSPEQARVVPKVAGFLGVAPEPLSRPHEPAFARVRITQIHSGTVSIVREDREIVRRSDGRVVGRVIRYGRGGGDFPSLAFPSSYSCPDYMSIYKGIDSIYLVKESSK